MPDLVGNPEDRLSRDAVHIKGVLEESGLNWLLKMLYHNDPKFSDK